MKYWLMKNEPEDYSIEDLKRDKTEPWDGIRNYQVRNMIRDDMSIGDLAFFYHSNCDEPGIYGIMDYAKNLSKKLKLKVVIFLWNLKKVQ